MTRTLEDAVRRVVVNGNCTGCGGCALVSARIEMHLDTEGYMRPSFTTAEGEPDSDREERALFEATCPGRRVRAPELSGATAHAVFGSYVSVWKSWAIDDDVRESGSSGGVLTALAAWLVETGRTRSVIGSSPGASPTRSVPIQIVSKDQALRAAGSRYAPVSNLPLLASAAADNALIGKPCEATAARQYFDAIGSPQADHPILLSFFCAGTPSQQATDTLVEELGFTTDGVTALRYRGNGWPGTFAVRSESDVRELSYDESWGQHLGRRLQWRCKLCVDGTGGHADIAVGDYWRCDERGYPVFDDADGVSVAIARTRRGHELLLEAERCGILHLEEIDIDSVLPVQPLQVGRKQTLAGRLLGRMAGGRRVPRYAGYGLLVLAARTPVAALRSAAGTFVRTISG
ncbi:hypothetical protein OPAG_07668 [Rhodococcus opacus PD630]|uniref:Coenzyme F420 hydrogenase/dehydrogenase, beta subunit C-terminal domain n=1 Tax=Rhodococcus TaxID=1827 RepID=UPI00029CB5D4|nr:MULTISPECIES: Coenzyme F420 hydrogenase/dehydrogenase, beta subunit C-terminal domain [Rhodococcus]KXF52036.1 coenzyme F420 hydrogenase [Rhodococcus sp. SC4]AHK29219.1 Coenzyme F420 hydrogenase subunit beta [Rhodococcus opacus PD630]EHI45559.1 hypothetical protein OPAG_07668 [Rhodococcus opacus PD630]KXX60688.1 coenzyme F420 hydrogenase [Rhodococcus sp. LB1]PBC58318.1 coenzyme F420 hydrogenase [Rhodococcus sp. ACPA1]